jgi:hypothetical protein
MAWPTWRNEGDPLSAARARQRLAVSSKTALLGGNAVFSAISSHCTARARQYSEVCGDLFSAIARFPSSIRAGARKRLSAASARNRCQRCSLNACSPGSFRRSVQIRTIARPCEPLTALARREPAPASRKSSPCRAIGCLGGTQQHPLPKSPPRAPPCTSGLLWREVVCKMLILLGRKSLAWCGSAQAGERSRRYER